MPEVSVIIATYNRPDTLNEALASIYAQDYSDIEVICIRDGGCKVDPLYDRRLIFIDNEENRGAAHAFNCGLRAARGSYVCYIGDDDKYYPNHVSTLLRAAQRTGVAYSDLYRVYYRLIDGKRVALSKNIEISRDFTRELMWYFNHVLGMALFHRRDLIAKTGLYNEELTALIDWDMTRRLAHYVDFVHTTTITGEYWGEVGGGDRISARERRNTRKFQENILKIRHTRPPKPWIVDDLAIVCKDPKIRQSIHNIVWYPHTVISDTSEADAEWICVAEDVINPFELCAANEKKRRENKERLSLQEQMKCCQQQANVERVSIIFISRNTHHCMAGKRMGYARRQAIIFTSGNVKRQTTPAIHTQPNLFHRRSR